MSKTVATFVQKVGLGLGLGEFGVLISFFGKFLRKKGLSQNMGLFQLEIE